MDQNVLRKYLDKACKQSLINFTNDAELNQFLSDFRSARVFAKKLDEIDVSGSEPLENVLDFYGGNDEKMREEFDHFTDFDSDCEDDFVRFEQALMLDKFNDSDPDFLEDANADYEFDMKSVNKNVRGNLVVAPSSLTKDSF